MATTERISILERLWALSCPEPNSGCWLFAGSDWSDNGYGRIRWRGRRWRVHRLAFHLLKGRLRRGKEILHRCDTRACWNPDHLQQGTTAANARDRHRKGRTRGAPGCSQAGPLLHVLL